MARKLLVSLMIFSLLCGYASAIADEAKTIYTSDFSKDEDGWYGRGSQSFRTENGTQGGVHLNSDDAFCFNCVITNYSESSNASDDGTYTVDFRVTGNMTLVS